MDVDFQVIFWGVRGSLPVPGPDTVIFGGNTSCVQVQIGKRLFILDAGTGIFKLGQELIKRNEQIYGDIFITHTHWDHIQGFPFFGPAFKKGNHFTLYGQSKVDLPFIDLMKGQMMYDHFPVSLDEMGAIIDFHELQSGQILDLGDDILLKTQHINHPGGCLGYRLEHKGRSCCYIADAEHSYPHDPSLIDFVAESDLIIYDANFTDQEYVSYKGWGHSTWQEGIKLIKKSKGKKLILFHHANSRSDSEMLEIERDAQKHFPGCIAAREGMVISL